VAAAAGAVAGPGAGTSSAVGGGRAVVVVRARVELLLPGTPSLPVVGRSTAAVEVGAGEGAVGGVAGAAGDGPPSGAP
jgi:hypothetical protein